MRCISDGTECCAESHNVALSATEENTIKIKKRRKPNEESGFGVSCHSMASVNSRATQAEGTGLEPATPYGALHFQ